MLTDSLRQHDNFLVSAFRRRLRQWIKRRIPPARRITLDHGNIFILPGRQGLGFCFMLALMFIGAINYEASLAFALVFLLLGMFLLSIFHVFRNLSGLTITGLAQEAVFAGERIPVDIILERSSRRPHESIRLAFPDTQAVIADLVDTSEARIRLYVPGSRRGYQRPGRLLIESSFPLGLCRAWSLVDMDLNCLVYPKPVACDLDWLLASNPESGQLNLQRGQDDFHGLKEYQQGDSLRHVAWKNFARGQGMYTKIYSSNVDDRVWLDWDMFPDLDIEQRLSRLCFCVLQLESRQVDYGLRLPGTEIMPAKGEQHYHQVLRVLALYGSDEPGQGI